MNPEMQKAYDRKHPLYRKFSEFCEQTDLNTFWEKADLNGVAKKILHVRPQYWFVAGGEGQIEFYDFANFYDEVQRLGRVIGAPKKEDIPHINESERKHYSEELSERSVSRIREFYADDFALLDRVGVLSE